MRKILILILGFLAFNINAQELLKEGGFKTSGATTGQTIKWNGSTWTPSDDLGSTSFATVTDSTAFRAFNTATAPSVVIMVDSVRGGIFERTYTETADQRMVFTDALSRKWTRLFDKKTVNVRWFGAIPDDGITDSLAVQLALDSPYDVFFPAGTYLTGQHTLTTPKNIYGRNAIWQLRTGLSTGTRMLTIMSNNVTVDGLFFIGKIATQTSEFSHGLTVGKPISDISAIGYNNVILRNLRFTDIRGDGIMVTASGLAEPLFSSNVIIENVVMDNILRNGVSIISGKNITVKNLYTSRIGLFGLDAEPDIATQFCDEIHITGYYGPGIGIGHHLTLNNNFTLEDFIIDGFRHGSTPAYTASLPFSRTGLNIRQSENVSVKNGIIRRTGGYGIVIGNTTTPFKRAVFENIKMDSVGYDVFYSFAKMIQQDNTTSDSSLIFKGCYFNGNGVVDQVGFPNGSRVYDCTITGFDRLLVTSNGGHLFERCSILLNTGSNNDLVYDGFGGATFRDCYINCDYLVRGQQSDNKVFEFDNCDIVYSTAPYSSMSLAPGTKFLLNRNKINGSNFQSAGNGATIFHDKVLSTGITASSVIIPTFLLHPKNTIFLMNETEGRAVTVDPESTTTINGVSTASTVSNITLTNTGTTWHFQADGAAGASNGLTLSGSTIIQGGRFTQNTSQSGRLLYSLSIDSLTNLNLRYNTNGTLFSTNNGSVGFRIGGDVTSGSIFGTDESFIATTAGGSGIWNGFGKLVIGSRINNSIVFTTDRTNPDLTLSTTEALFARRGSFENNIWVKNTGTYTNITNSFAPLVKENFTLSGRTWISSGGDVPLILGGSEAARPTSAITDNGGYIVTSGGGTAGTAFENYGSLILGARYSNPIFFMTSKLDNPKMRIGETGIQIGNGMTAARDSLDVVGTVRFEGLPSKTSETNVVWRNTLGQLATGGITPSDLGQQGAATGEVIKWNGTIWAPATDAGGGGGATDLTFSGTSSPVTLNSSTGTDVDFIDGAGITIAGTSTTLTLNNNLTTGVSGGQTVVGGTASGNSLTISSTTNATKGDILFGTSAYKEATNRLGIGTTSPSATVHVTQASVASVGSGSGTNAPTLLTVTGTAGGATSAGSGTVSGGNGSSSTITGGAGGAITGTPGTGFGGAGGSITLLGGNGGNGTTFGGTAGFVEIAGGTGGTGTTAGAAGYVSMKGGNAGATGNGDGGNVFLVGGIPTGAGSPGHIYLGLSPSLTQRGNVKIGGSSPPTNLLTIGESGTKLGDIGLAGNTSGMVTIRPAAAAGTWTLTFPTDDGTPGQVMTTDGAGVCTWTTVSGGGGGISSLNTLTGATQTFATGTSGSNFNISSVGTTHTFNIPDAGVGIRGLVNTTSQPFNGLKTFIDGIEVGDIGSTDGFISFAASNGNAVAIKSSTGTGNWTMTMPTSAGTNGQVMTTNGSGVTSWTTVSGGSGYTTIQEEGTGLTARSTLNFAGSTATAADDGTKTNVTFDSDVNALASTASTGLYVVTGTGTSVTRSIAAGTGISISNTNGVVGNPTITNLAPDQTVTIASGTDINVTGTYPSFTINNTQTEVNGIFSASGTVPNGVNATQIDDLTFTGVDNTGTQSPKFRVVASGTDPGVQVWKVGNDSLQLSFISGEPTLEAIGTAGNDFWINAVGNDLRLGQGSTGVFTHTTKNVLGGYLAVPYITATANTTVSESTQEVDVIGTSSVITLTFNNTSNLLGSAAKTITVRNRGAFDVTLSRGSQTWEWSDMSGVNTATDRTLAAGEIAVMFWIDDGVTDYYILHKIQNLPTAKISEQTATTINFDGRATRLYVPTSATTTAINLPEIVASAPSATQVTIGATFEITIDRAVTVTISRSGASDVILAHNYVGSQTSITTTGGTTFSQKFTAIGANTWIVE